MIGARMRAGASWSEAFILNMSSKGLLVRSDQSPSRGSYLEICRGHHVIVARVVWSGSGRFGVQTQDPVPAASLIRNPDALAPAKPSAANLEDRREASRPPPQVRHEGSRQKARVAEFMAVALLCGLAALLIAGTLGNFMAAPLDAVQAALAAK
jgi:hypothetical protein